MRKHACILYSVRLFTLPSPCIRLFLEYLYSLLCFSCSPTPSERTPHDSRDCRSSHTSTASTFTFFPDASFLPSPNTPDAISYPPSSSYFHSPPCLMSSNVLIYTSSSKSPLLLLSSDVDLWPFQLAQGPLRPLHP